MISVALLIILIAAVGIVTALLVWKRKKEVKLEEPNYRAFFVMGIIWFPIGIVSMFIVLILDIPPFPIGFVAGMPLFAMGLIYFIIGLTNRDKWKKKQ